jgi:hypothetical protein
MQAEVEALKMGLMVQEEGLKLLYSEICALQAMIPARERTLPSDAETEAAFDNMPV